MPDRTAHAGNGRTGRTRRVASEPRTRVNEAYERIREVIVEQQIKANSTITEAQLTRDLHMSRTPVREALTRLESEGYVQPAAGRGYTIVEMTAEDLVNVYAVRAELDALAAGEAAKRIRRVDLAHLEDLYDDMAVALSENRDQDLATLNSEFHATIAEISGNSYLKRMLDDIRNTFDLFRMRALTVPGRRDDSHAEHGQLIEALRQNDTDLARRIARLHVQRALLARQSTASIDDAARSTGRGRERRNDDGSTESKPRTMELSMTNASRNRPLASATSTGREPTTMSLLEQLDELASRVPDAAAAAAATLATDFMGVAVAGSRTPEGRVIYDYATTLPRPGACNVAAHPDNFDAATAALVTGTSGYAIGLTDTHARSITHSGPSIIPAALAVAQMVDASGRDFLDAVVLGCETVVRIGSVVNPSHRARGYHPTATCNVFGAAVAAAKLLGLDREQTANALGIAGSMSGGIYEFRHEGSMLMAFHAGWPAHNGIVAALLAQRGFTGPHTVLEGPEGFFRAFSDEIHPELLAVNLESPGVLEIGLRPYNACRYGHSGVDAVLTVVAKHGALDASSVRHVTVATHSTAVAQESEPNTVVGARLSTAFTVAYALAHGPKIDEVHDSDLNDPVVRQLIERTEVIEDPELTAIFPEKWACRVTVELDDGTIYEERVDVPKGEPENPMSPADVSRKFHTLVDPVLGRDRADALEAEFHAVTQAASVQPLAHALAGA